MLKVLFDEDVQQIFDAFAACFGVRMVFFSPDLDELKVGLNERKSRFCTLLQERLGWRPRCRQDDRAHAAISAEQRRLVAYGCHAGLTEAIMPVYAGSTLAGYVLIGQVRTTRRLPRALATAWQQAGGAAQEMEDAYAALPYLPPDRLRNMLKLFELTVQYLTSRHLIAVDQAELVETVLDYLRHNLDRPLSLAELTAYTGKSASTLARAFKQARGTSLKRAMIEMKLDAADQYFADHPGATITETAFALGFPDPLYFSRLYKKYRHTPPSARQRQLASVSEEGNLLR